MNVTTVPESKPEVAITILWREAEILQRMLWSTGGVGEGCVFINSLSGKLGGIGVSPAEGIKFRGNY
ncbi:hypothetical protein LCGC14_2483440 [marine sediment metagenome]|uniref:Uncharacterized protein n=1 Tax=marine sediment metagenome TaxID=412755 RepID=A0A0F9E0L8_9ZZZZ